MAFRFALAALLRLRQSREQQHERLFHEANLRRAELRRALEAVARAVSQLKENDSQGLNAGMRAAELQFDLLRLSRLAEHRCQLEREVAQAEAECARRLQQFRQAHGERQIIESLRDRQLHSYQRWQEKQAERNFEDLLLLRRERRSSCHSSEGSDDESA